MWVRWVLGLGASALLHAGVAGLYISTQSLDAPPDQPKPQSRMQLDTISAPRQTAEAQDPGGTTAAEAAATGTQLGGGAIVQSRLEALAPKADRSEASDASGARLSARPAVGAALAPAAAIGAALTPKAPQAVAARAAPSTPVTAAPAAFKPQALTASAAPVSQLASLPPTGADAAEAEDTGARLAAERPQSTDARAANPDAQPVEPASVPADLLAAQAAAPDQAPARAPDTDIAALSPATGTPAPGLEAKADRADPAALPATTAKASTALRFGDRLITDPGALATISAFMEPGTPEAQVVRDDLSGVLTGVNCARVSATYLPEAGALELRGHIPDPALQGPLLDALSAQVGDGIPVRANLLHLPAPQCGALTGIADLGLPQSTDQFTNDRLIGASAHARAYDYSEGQRLQFDLVAPDYDAYVYVDYFNADGEVIHLVPNEIVPLAQTPAKTTFDVGRPSPGKPSLDITIGPPFGQEIAVAFASSVPLYEGVRPLVEPAEPYLDDLKARIAEARAARPDFKGEWVYFFITTSPALQ